MTTIVLVPNPNAVVSSGQRHGEPYVPLGLLSLATVLRRDNFSTRIVDINRACSSLDPQECADAILSEKPDIIGFSTQTNEYPRTLQIAELCKQKFPRSSVILGGPQASTTDVATMTAFRFVDLVVRGECEKTISALINTMAAGRPLNNIPGITFRRGGQIVRAREAPLAAVLDDLPIPDYSLVPNVQSYDSLPIEVGRGCPFGCTFCSSKDFFQRRFRFRNTRLLLQLISHLREEYNVRNYSFEHDNVTVSKAKILELCDGIKKLGLDISWSCSARVDCLDQELVERMAGAGCNGIFMGIETGSPRMQKIVGKRLDLDKVIPLAESLRHKGIEFTASFMMGFPEETLEDLEMTIRLITILRFKGNGCETVQLHMLSAFPGTETYEENKSNLLFDGFFPDTAIADLTESMIELVKSHQEIFPSYYYVKSEHLERRFLLQVNFLVLTLLNFFPYTSLAMSQMMSSNYPRQVLSSLPTLDIPDSVWAVTSDDVRIRSVYEFLKGVFQRQGSLGKVVLDVLDYEKAAADLSRGPLSDDALLVREFEHNVQGWISNAAGGEVSSLSELCQIQVNQIMFFKNDGKVKTVVLPPQVVRSVPEDTRA